jgi:hypothetical protein
MNPYYVATSHHTCDFCGTSNIPTAAGKKRDVDICRVCLLGCREAFDRYEADTDENHERVRGLIEELRIPKKASISDITQAKTAMEAAAMQEQMASAPETGCCSPEQKKAAASIKLTQYQNEAITDALCRLIEHMHSDSDYVKLLCPALINACLAINDKTYHSLSNSPCEL